MQNKLAVYAVLLYTMFVLAPLGARGADEDIDHIAEPQRIVQAGSSAFIVENALYLFPEARGRVVALARGDQGNGFFVGDIDPDIENKLILPRRANTETILAENPDVVVMKNFMKSSGMGEALERVGVSTVYLDLESPEAWMRDLDTLGELFGNEGRAAELKDHFASRISAVTDPLISLPESEKPEVLFLYWSVRDGENAVNIPPLSWIQTRMVELAGGLPVWRDADLSERWTRTGVEQIAAWNPEVIVVAAYHIPTQEAVAAILNDPTWSSLDAVRAGRVYAFPGDYHSGDQPDARWLLGLQWLGALLHRDKYPELDMEAEARSFYRDLFFLAAAAYDVLIEPRLSGLE